MTLNLETVISFFFALLLPLFGYKIVRFAVKDNCLAVRKPFDINQKVSASALWK